MKAIIITIGNELLSGERLDTNAHYLAAKLSDMGLQVIHIISCPDEKDTIASVFEQSLETADIVVSTGGLGPTPDDQTLAAIAKVLKKKFTFDISLAKKIRLFYKQRRIPILKEAIRQAYIPEDAVVMENKTGTAPGLIVEVKNKKYIVAMPGPGQEMKQIFEDHLSKFLRKKTANVYSAYYAITIACTSELEVLKKIKDLFPARPPVKIGIYPEIGQVCVKVTSRAPSKVEAEKLIAPFKRALRARFKLDMYTDTKPMTFETLVVDALKKVKYSVAFAESCTGGLLSSRITKVPGSSKIFKRTVVAYSDQAKIELLGVKKEMLVRFGAVSPQAAKAMAEHIKNSAATDIGIAVTGIAGPSGSTKDKPVGLVYIAVVTKKINVVFKFNFVGTREQIQYLASQYALRLLYDIALRRKISP